MNIIRDFDVENIPVKLHSFIPDDLSHSQGSLTLMATVIVTLMVTATLNLLQLCPSDRSNYGVTDYVKIILLRPRSWNV